MNNKVKILLVWISFLSIFVGGYKLFFEPTIKESKKIAEIRSKQEAEQEVLELTSSDSRYDYQVTLRLDNFSGYSVLRSNEFKRELASHRINYFIKDDEANYEERLKALSNGECQFAVFTIDGLYEISSKLDDISNVIFMIVDETLGADAIISYKDSIASLDDLNRADVKIGFVENTPSEFLIKVAKQRFGLDYIENDCFEYFSDQDELFKHWRVQKSNEKRAYVTWEPIVSKMLENPNTHKLLDTSQLKGYIVDCLVVNRKFLLEHQDIVETFAKDYFTTLHKKSNNMEKLLIEDAIKNNQSISEEQAANLAEGIWFKNTLENYSHFGIENNSLQHIEDMILQIGDVLNKLDGIEDPTDGKPNLFYYTGILDNLNQSNFHPGSEKIKDQKYKFKKLSNSQIEKLMPIGTLQIPSLIFARGTDRLTGRSYNVLDDLSKTIDSFSQAYVTIIGDHSLRGNKEANSKLALQRTIVAKKYLIEKGIEENRLINRTIDVPTGKTEVKFILSRLPY